MAAPLVSRQSLALGYCALLLPPLFLFLVIKFVIPIERQITVTSAGESDLSRVSAMFAEASHKLREAQKAPNKAPEPTIRAVTPPAAQESRQP